ncbi:hypothetical protein ACOMHN_049233 [Nucella lapillus]
MQAPSPGGGPWRLGLGGVHLLYGLAGGRVSPRGVDLLSCCAVVDVRVDDPLAVSAALRSERGDGCEMSVVEAGPAGRQRSARRSVPAGLTMRELVMAIAAMFRAVGCDLVAGAVVVSSPVVDNWMITATVHGQGVYFAKTSHYSARELYSPKDEDGKRYMYQSKILVGVSCLGDQNMRVLPARDGNVMYDSACDDVSDPGIYVIFLDMQAYPEYLITFKNA